MLRLPGSFFERTETDIPLPDNDALFELYLILIERVRRNVSGCHERPGKGRPENNSGNEPA